MEMAVINENQIELISNCIKDISLKKSYLNRTFISFDAPREYKANAYLIASAICHQTHNLKNISKNLIGWNYIEYVFEHMARARNKILDFSYINQQSCEELSIQLEQLFPVSDTSNESSLDYSLERAIIVKEIVKTVIDEGFSNALEYLTNRDFSDQVDVEVIYGKLERIDAFKDPLKKKSTLFIKLISSSKTVEVNNISALKPLMDYHMQRLLLRTGCVIINDMHISEKLRSREKLKSDEEIRKACVKAITHICKKSGISILDIDDLFWAIGRSCCNNKILCVSGTCDKSPCTLLSMIEIDDHRQCILGNGCMGKSVEAFRTYFEPNVSTNYY